MAIAKQRVRQALLVALGLLAWLVTQTVALGLAGGGDGWNAPDLFSLPLLLLYPLAASRAFRAGKGGTRIDAAILLIAASLDVLLMAWGIPRERDYFQRAWKFAPEAVIIWMALWAGWQLFAIAAVVRSRRGLLEAGGA
jgi:hypothetical protein